MAKPCILFTYLCFILLRGDLNICDWETDEKLTGLCCSSMDVLPAKSSSRSRDWKLWIAGLGALAPEDLCSAEFRSNLNFSSAEFRSNPHLNLLILVLMIRRTLQAGMVDLNSAGKWPSRSRIAHLYITAYTVLKNLLWLKGQDHCEHLKSFSPCSIHNV